MSGCNAKHTNYQPTDDEWKCPKCGAGSGEFLYDDMAELAGDECGLLHDEDSLVCVMKHGEDGSRFLISGEAFAAGFQSKADEKSSSQPAHQATPLDPFSRKAREEMTSEEQQSREWFGRGWDAAMAHMRDMQAARGTDATDNNGA